jgi:pyruvate/2-oxoglutarate/acetoin dehydrogenase E1 component
VPGLEVYCPADARDAYDLLVAAVRAAVVAPVDELPRDERLVQLDGHVTVAE